MPAGLFCGMMVIDDARDSLFQPGSIAGREYSLSIMHDLTNQDKLTLPMYGTRYQLVDEEFRMLFSSHDDRSQPDHLSPPAAGTGKQL